MVRNAPPLVVFVDHPSLADVQIVHCLGAGSLTKIRSKRFVLVQHNLLNSDIAHLAIWRAIFQEACLVVSYTDLQSLLNSKTFNFLQIPWGVDLRTFRNYEQSREHTILTTGWSCSGEAIAECYSAVTKCGGTLFNVGEDFRFGANFRSSARLTDAEFCHVLNRCRFVSGLRFREGFEISIIEGLACGCRPICFDLPVYRHWFETVPVYVPHVKGTKLESHLESVFRTHYPAVSASELEFVRSRFDWQNICDTFWRSLLKYV